MKIQLIRNATMKITYAGHTILTDPMLSAQGAFQSFAGIAPNPTISLPFAAEEVVKGIECVLVTHVHPDHFDTVAHQTIPKATPMFCQPEDHARMTEEGFQHIFPIQTSHIWEGITFTRTGGQHGSGKILEMMGTVSGFIFQAKGEPTVYWVGDSIWCDQVEKTIALFNPDIIITHSGGATIPGFETIIMDVEQTLTTVNAAPQAIVVAIHTESLDHCTVTRAHLRQMANQADISPSRLMIPADGETISF